MKYESKLTNFYMKDAEKSDVKDILKFIKGIAKYEEMENLVVATEEKLLDSIFVKGHARVILAMYNDKPVGMALYFFNYSTFLGGANIYLEDLFIEEEYRSFGFGKELFRALALVAKRNNCKRLDWSCLDWNEPSLKFYKKLGAKAMTEWVLHRLDAEAIDKVASGEY